MGLGALNAPSSHSMTASVRFGISALQNGIPLISSWAKGSFSAFGVYLSRLGTANESASEAGSNYVLSKTFLSHTGKRSEGELGKFLEQNCATIVPNFAKEYAVLTAGFPAANADALVGLLCEMLTDPLILSQDIAQCSQIAEFELTQMLKLQPERILLDWVHFKAFGSNSTGLGNVLPLFAQNISALTPEKISGYLRRVVQPEALVLAAAEVSPSALAGSFGKLQINQPKQVDSKEENDSLHQHQNAQPDSKASRDKSPSELTIPNPEPESNEFTRLALAFPAASLTAPDYWTFAVITSLLGGGSSFSSGGPGKGMYSRLYTQVLNQYHWSESAQAFSFPYKNTGLFGIHGACVPGNAQKMLGVFFSQLASIASASEAEVQRAKNQAKSAILMALESRVGQVEYMAKQFDASALSADTRRIATCAEISRAVEAVSMHDLQRVSRQLLSEESAPTVVMMDSREGKDSIPLSLICHLQSKYNK